MATKVKETKPAQVQGRRMPVRTEDFELTGDWVGWAFTAKTSLSMGAGEDLTSGDFERIKKTLAEIIVTWNFVDSEGKALPDPAALRQKSYTDEVKQPLNDNDTQAKRDEELLLLMRQVPIELALEMVAAISLAFQKSSNRSPGKR